jgi:hypothetical protein
MEIQIPWTISPQPNVYKVAKNNKKTAIPYKISKKNRPERRFPGVRRRTY